MTKKFKLVLIYSDDNKLDNTVYSDSLRVLYDIYECVASQHSLQLVLFYKLNQNKTHEILEKIVYESE